MSSPQAVPLKWFPVPQSRWKGNDQEPIQSNFTSWPRHQMGKEHIQFRRHKIRTARAESSSLADGHQAILAVVRKRKLFGPGEGLLTYLCIKTKNDFSFVSMSHVLIFCVSPLPWISMLPGNRFLHFHIPSQSLLWQFSGFSLFWNLPLLEISNPPRASFNLMKCKSIEQSSYINTGLLRLE